MSRPFLIGGWALVLLVACALAAPNEEAEIVTIPLDQIWAYDMPGTRDIRELEPKRDIRNLTHREYILGSFVNQIIVLLSKVPKEGEKAGVAFVVVGTGEKALNNTHAVIVQNKMKQPERSMPRNVDLSLVFYSYATGWRVHISSVERSTTIITVKYQFIAQSIGHFGTSRFAIIPIGKLTQGTKQVKIEQVPPVDAEGQPAKPFPNPIRFVCDSFSFLVR